MNCRTLSRDAINELFERPTESIIEIADAQGEYSGKYVIDNIENRLVKIVPNEETLLIADDILDKLDANEEISINYEDLEKFEFKFSKDDFLNTCENRVKYYRFNVEITIERM